MLCIYSRPVSNDNSVINAQTDILDDLLSFSIPWNFLSDIMEYDNRINHMLDYFMLVDTNQYNTAQFYFTYMSP